MSSRRLKLQESRFPGVPVLEVYTKQRTNESLGSLVPSPRSTYLGSGKGLSRRSES